MNLSIFVFKYNRNNTEAANARCEKSEKNVSSSDEPKRKCVNSLVAILLIKTSIIVCLFEWIKYGLIYPVHPYTASNEPGAEKTVDYVLCWMRPRRILVGFLITPPNSSCDANEIFEDWEWACNFTEDYIISCFAQLILKCVK